MAIDNDASYGVQFTVTVPDTGATITVQRDTSGAFGTAVTIATVTTARTISDVLPADGITRYYRAKATRAGYTDSSWSATISQAPHQISSAPPL